MSAPTDDVPRVMHLTLTLNDAQLVVTALSMAMKVSLQTTPDQSHIELTPTMRGVVAVFCGHAAVDMLTNTENMGQRLLRLVSAAFPDSSLAENWRVIRDLPPEIQQQLRDLK